MKQKWIYGKYIDICFSTSFEMQVELLPRITILYRTLKGIALEWLWFSIYFELVKNNFNPKQNVNE